MKKEHITIIGGGYIGLTAAYFLSKLGINVTVLESGKKGIEPVSPGRLLAIAMGSIQIYQKFGLDIDFASLGQAINHIRVWDQITDTKLDFSPDDIAGYSEFGYMIPEYDLKLALLKKIEGRSNIELIYNASQLIENEEEWRESCDLAILADGKDSNLWKKLGISKEQHNYNQTAIVAEVTHEENHEGVAVEQFFQSGPFAILPKKGGHMSSIVWVEPKERIESIKAFDIEFVEELIAQRFNGYLGNIKLASPIQYFPLRMSNCYSYHKPQLAVVGDAAHGIHPLAGQGLNLGIRDLQVLVRLIEEQMNCGLDIGSLVMLQEYSQTRKADVNMMIEATHNLNSVFLSKNPVIKLLRSIGMKSLDKSDYLKRMCITYAMGLGVCRDQGSDMELRFD